MNDAIQNMLNRRSCRAFQKKQIEEAELEQILQAGLCAPSGMGKQSPILVVLQDPEEIATVSRMNAAVMGTDSDPFYGAPTVVVVLADSSVRTYVEDGSLTMGNLMLAASSLGVGSCWIHRAKEVFASEEGKALLKKWGVPDGYVGVGNCILGYRKGEKQAAAPRRKIRIYRPW